MREFKFRAWDEKKNVMWYQYGSVPGVYKFQFSEILFIFDKSIHIKEHTYDKTYILENCPLMQYTGLKDNDGKDIYEGDIIKWIYSYSEFEDLNELTEFDTDVIENIWDVDKWRGCESHFELEIIGNIFENPELMEVK